MQRKLVFSLVLLSFLFNILAPYNAQAQAPLLPPAGQLLTMSQNYSLPILKGLKLDSQDPLHIQFIIDTADQAQVNKEEAVVLIRYFLAGLTIPEQDIWVNLSPYEKDRVVPQELGLTDLGEDMLAQDYVLKQLAASLTHPDTPQGKLYWDALRMQNAKLKMMVFRLRETLIIQNLKFKI